MQFEESRQWRAQGVPGVPRFQEQLTLVATTLEEGLTRRDLSGFYDAFRSTELPFIGAANPMEAYGLFRACFDILHRLGGLSPAAALAIENHYYILSALVTFPTGEDVVLERRRRALLEHIVKNRLLVANTNATVHTSKLGTRGLHARREGRGFRVSGTADFTSLASQGDILVFIATLEGEGPAVFYTPMRGNPSIELGPLLLPDSMLESDTRRLTIRDLALSEENLFLSGAGARMEHLLAFEHTWHQLLIPTLYLGAAARALEEARRFLRSTKGPDDHPLAELDGMIVDVGRLLIEYRSARCLALQAGQGLTSLTQTPVNAQTLEDVFDLAGASKLVGTRCAEEILGVARRIIGTRAFTGGHPIERLSRDIMFGPLGPKVNAAIERTYGQRVLGERSFLEQC
jgi:alkylation response protein AidB-like acyl-CoA dehydrogenase